jgi:tetratricopeptide (TPR) repeat protein
VLRSDTDRARIEVAAAALSGDVEGRVNALKKLVALTPGDLGLLGTLAETQMNARDFSGAAQTFEKILETDPDNASAMNSAGYALAQAGQLDQARAKLEAYGRQPGQETNSLDSLGEAYFINGRFSEAEKFFLAAHHREAGFLGGVDLSKAAYARWLSGDLQGADATMKQYFDAHRNDPLAAWREASWLYTTGRREQAVKALERVPDKALAARQLVIWNGKLGGDLASLKKKYEATQPPADGEVRVFYAAALVAAGDRDEARKILKLWPIPEERGEDPLAESIVYPKFIELRKAVGL